jgi:hypothetical protein
MIEWHTENRNLKDLRPHPKNPRQLTKDQERQLRKSIETFGLAEALVINTDNMIIGGHQRYNLLKKLKFKEVACWVPSQKLTDAECDELCVRLNRNHGDFDYDILANEFNVCDLLDWGFRPEELELISAEDIESEEKDKKKNLKSCPKCGHEF